jgi:limonene-1,2-epoxide hydrolase
MKGVQPMDKKRARIEVVQKYFYGQNKEDREAVVGLFEPTGHEIHNVYFPILQGPDAARKLCDALYARTKRREFKVIAIALTEDGNTFMTQWEATLTYRQGAVVGDLAVPHDFDTTLRGVNVFSFCSGSEKIRRLDIFHETTSIPTQLKKLMQG